MIQNYDDDTGSGPAACCPEPLTAGGNTTLIDGMECKTLSATFENTPIVRAALDDDFSHVQGVYRMQNL